MKWFRCRTPHDYPQCREGRSGTYVQVHSLREGPFGAGRGDGGGGGGGGASPALLFVVELEVLEALRERQFLLDGHAQQRVQRLLLVLSGRQLPLHVVQLDHVLVTSTNTVTERERE